MEVDETSLTFSELEAIARRVDRPIVLIGMMGVGKTTVGRKLAAALHLGFTDSDEEIELAAQMTIPEIFDTYGEPFFRDGERRVIARLIEGGPRVIATGGGAFCNDETRALILERTICVWLDSDIDTLLERVSRKDNRPLLKQGDPRQILTALHADRQPIYSQAPLHVISGNTPHSRTVTNILRKIDAWL
jgi:shikimate kinase